MLSIQPFKQALGSAKIQAKPLRSVPERSVRFGDSLLNEAIYKIDFSTGFNDEKVAQLSQTLQKMALQKKITKDPGSIKLMIKSPGGSVSAGYKIIGLIKQLEVPVDTVVMGNAASMGAILAIAGASKGRRFMDRYANLMIHQPSIQGLEGTAEYVENYSRHLMYERNRMDGIISQHTGLPLEKVRKITGKDTYIYPLRALKDGFVDWVLVEGSKGLNKRSIQHLSEEEIDRRDQYNQYDDLRLSTVDPMLSLLSQKAMNQLPAESSEANGSILLEAASLPETIVTKSAMKRTEELSSQLIVGKPALNVPEVMATSGMHSYQKSRPSLGQSYGAASRLAYHA